ncbi:cytochrome P450 [Dictyobacter formicarum]|uniref:Cytochrome P450 n=1 Tax=Dictyobacter formicarum TaxID=2778368 RepID=A0ABQ3VT88_9CHLR|nr:cytochrome P450 [Dictyobacter formicarum]GHO88839.1 cytochrome P450 [Dictyobacter formicarum]
MTQTVIIPPEKLFAQVLDPASRANPYPLYTRLRETPISVQEDGTYVVSTYREISLLLHDPRISSDERKSAHPARALAAPSEATTPSLIFTDPPEHTRLRRLVMHQFTPQRIGGMREDIEQVVNTLLDARKQQNQLDVVQDFAYPLPVMIICRLLGVPPEDEPRFRVWSSDLVRTLDPTESLSEAEVQQAAQSRIQMREYMKQLSETRRAHPQDDLFSGLVVGDDPDGRLSEPDLLATMQLLLIAGHETTVNLITNSMLTLLRHPEVFDRLRRNPALAIPTVEEVLRYDPPVQFRTRTTLTDVPIAGVTIPQGASVVLLLAAGSRDPARFVDPDRFWPERDDNEHLGFGGSDHYCIGAPLARLEAVTALKALARRLEAPRLVTDLPPYRKNAALRGPEHLQIAFDHLSD